MATLTIVAPGHVHLILSHSTDDFYLKIPISIVDSNSVHPLKYLRFLGWCIIGILGTIRSHRADADLVETVPLQDEGTYFYVYDAADDDAALKYAVDPEVIKARSHISASDSSVQARTAAFKESLEQRDASCIFTNAPQLVCQGTHIIPLHKGDEWFDLIVKNRPAADEDKSTLTTVNDQRNGMLLRAELHIVAELRNVVVLKTPNPVLATSDIPPRHTRNCPDDVKYPDGHRYTLQWLHGDSPEQLTQLQALYPNNSDATFRKRTRIPKPSPLLLHYNYGAAAVKWWGHGTSHLGILNRPTMPRPIVPMPAAMGPTRTRRTGADLNVSLKKRAGAAGGSGSGPRDSEARDEQVLDADEVIMFFWSQNPAALERRKQEAEDQKHEQEERASRLEQWRESVMAI
ncbi:hypothetical protein C8F04DRAFT_1401491 [Mycena alexandri]|uniref:HNH nuclease domain-containing protein n=1 Tax=Mycena alexandri TaxID=1745969 RepID=A0AAD6WSZ1_9AGAR|nr:hypothetical protein C8F04DRAFT_1401491 [Mycena alexandri]